MVLYAVSVLSTESVDLSAYPIAVARQRLSNTFPRHHGVFWAPFSMRPVTRDPCCTKGNGTISSTLASAPSMAPLPPIAPSLTLASVLAHIHPEDDSYNAYRNFSTYCRSAGPPMHTERVVYLSLIFLLERSRKLRLTAVGVPPR
jgi:hypothetical protein